MKRSLQVIILGALSLAFFTACTRQTERPVMQFMPHMSNTAILKAERGYDGLGNGASVMMPPEHSIARGHKPYRIETPEEANAKLRNPLPLNLVTLERGQQVYNIYCMTCHGPRGLGDGPVVDPYPIPKSLQSEDMLRWGDGHLFHVITKGQGIMPSYAQQVQPQDRWAVIHYVRALQRAQNPTDEDVRELQKRVPKN